MNLAHAWRIHIEYAPESRHPCACARICVRVRRRTIVSETGSSSVVSSTLNSSILGLLQNPETPFCRSIMGNLEVWDRDYLDFTLRPTPFPLTPMGWSAAKKAANYLLLQAKTDATKNTKYLAACTNVTFHDNHRQWQKGLSLATLSEMKKTLSPGTRLWRARVPFTGASAE
jgi:hypothetical protein